MKPRRMGFTEFLHKHCFAHGGNWIAMLLSGIKSAFPEHYAQMPDKEYSLEEVFAEISACGVIFDE